jgi:TatD DNase family protein
VIDTHCHLDVGAFDADRDAVIERAVTAGVTRMLVPAIRPRTWPALEALAKRQPALRIAIGIHPQIVPELDESERAANISEAAVAAGAVAIGECGLDGSTDDLATQEEIFRAHIRAARETRLPLVVHVLRAHDRAPRILRDERASEVGGVMHSYSGGAELIAIYRDLGFSFSFAGPVTYPNARRPLDAARAVPDELLLVETDAPDQSPASHRGRSEPAYLPIIVEALAAARGSTAEAVAALTEANARRVFRW